MTALDFGHGLVAVSYAMGAAGYLILLTHG